MRSRLPRGMEFPNEGFVQQAIEAHFNQLGFEVEPATHADLVVAHPQTGERWIVEAKGKTTSVGLDFNTGIGQIVQRMLNRGDKFGLAVPEIPQFVTQCRRIPGWVRQALGLHWFLVDRSGTVRRCSPDKEV